MAELCLDCFLDTWVPNSYDQAHIVMSNDNEFCEGCMNCVPHVDYIDLSDREITATTDELMSVTYRSLQSGKSVACVECGESFIDDDFAFITNVGECPYCHKSVSSVWVKQL